MGLDDRVRGVMFADCGAPGETGRLDRGRDGTHLELESKFCTCPVLPWTLRAALIKASCIEVSRSENRSVFGTGPGS